VSAAFAELAPGVVAARAFSVEEAAVVRGIAEATGAWGPAVINDGNEVDRSIRDAQTLQADANPRLVGMCHQRLLAVTSERASVVAPGARLGEMQFVRYAAGGGYVEHRDTPDLEATTRVLSLVCYLNEDCAGGATVFPELGLRVEPSSGLVIAFDPTLLHAAEPVTAGTKIAITAWYHRRRPA
jgi:predicted 2-oxoglutarate/Fe(II)-dependent dioxygenase YbiX